jgi:hypothetical protein
LGICFLHTQGGSDLATRPALLRQQLGLYGMTTEFSGATQSSQLEKAVANHFSNHLLCLHTDTYGSMKQSTLLHHCLIFIKGRSTFTCKTQCLAHSKCSYS